MSPFEEPFEERFDNTRSRFGAITRERDGYSLHHTFERTSLVAVRSHNDSQLISGAT
jgi:hypothetical protein